MHELAYQWVQAHAHRVPPRSRLLEVGALNVNGTTRGLFQTCIWTGIDLLEGPGVDIVADAATYYPDEPFDGVVCTEVLEHAKDPKAVVLNIGQVTKPGGVLILTCAGPLRDPHAADGSGPPHEGEWYENIEALDLRAWLQEAGFSKVTVNLADMDRDLRAFAVK